MALWETQLPQVGDLHTPMEVFRGGLGEAGINTSFALSFFYQGNNAESFYQLVDYKIAAAYPSFPIPLRSEYMQCLKSIIVKKFAESVKISSLDMRVYTDWFSLCILENGETSTQHSHQSVGEPEPPSGHVALNALVCISSSRGKYLKIESSCRIAEHAFLPAFGEYSDYDSGEHQPVVPAAFEERPTSPEEFDDSLFLSSLVKDRLRKVVKDLPLFAAYSEAVSRDVLLDSFERVLKFKGDVIVREGDPEDFFYYIEAGLVIAHFSSKGAKGYGTKLHLDDGCHFGENASPQFANSTSTIIAESDCVLWRLSAEHIRCVGSNGIDADDGPLHKVPEVTVKTKIGVEYEYTRLKGEINSIVGWMSHCSSDGSPSTSPLSSPSKPSSFRSQQISPFLAFNSESSVQSVGSLASPTKSAYHVRPPQHRSPNQGSTIGRRSSPALPSGPKKISPTAVRKGPGKKFVNLVVEENAEMSGHNPDRSNSSELSSSEQSEAKSDMNCEDVALARESSTRAVITALERNSLDENDVDVAPLRKTFDDAKFSPKSEMPERKISPKSLTTFCGKDLSPKVSSKQTSPKLLSPKLLSTQPRSRFTFNGVLEGDVPRFDRRHNISPRLTKTSSKSTVLEDDDSSSDDSKFHVGFSSPFVQPYEVARTVQTPDSAVQRDGESPRELGPRRDLLTSAKNACDSSEEDLPSGRRHRKPKADVNIISSTAAVMAVDNADISSVTSLGSARNKLSVDPVVVVPSALPKLFVNVASMIASNGTDVEPLTRGSASGCGSGFNSSRSDPDQNRPRSFSIFSDKGENVFGAEESTTVDSRDKTAFVVEGADRYGWPSIGPGNDRRDSFIEELYELTKAMDGSRSESSMGIAFDDKNCQKILSIDTVSKYDKTEDDGDATDVDGDGFDANQIILDVDIGDGNVFPLVISRDSNPLELSYQFIQEHSFSAHYLEPLAVYIFKTRAKLLF
jgi:hypothetical protein